MAELDDSLFSRVLTSFRQRLSPQDINDFESTTLEDLKEEITRIQRIQVQRRSLRNLNKIKPFLNGIEQYSKVIEVFVNAKPDIMAFIWGPIKLCLQIASKLTEAFDALLDAYEKIGKSLPLFSKIESLFLTQSYVQQVLVDVYEDILDFHKRAIIFFKQSAWRLAFKVTIHTFADMFGDVIKKLERSKELLLQSANIAHYQEAQEFRLLFAKEFDAQQERTKKDRMLTVIDWLSPTSCDLDHEELQRKRNEFPETTRWIFKQDSMRRWLQDGNSNPMLWICGIPGAGKTVLFSSIVDQIKHIIPHSQTIFFYCKNRDPLTKTFDGIARSLIAQLLQQNPVSLDYLYEVAVDSGKRHPSTFKTYRDILEHITGAHDCLFIGIDGLDECEKEDRGFILSLLDHVLKASSPQAKIQIFLTSQRMSDLQKLLKSALRFDIKPQHIQQDIENYVKRRALGLCDEFGFGHEKERSITADICNRSEGMFLLARLIMDNLMAQDNIEDLEEELSTDILPKGINEAYGRILVRLSKSQHRKRQERATRVLELIITARYPLKIQELQGALSIRLEDMSVDFAKRCTVTSFEELCGPIVEVHVDGTISLVHPTAKLYLVQDHSGHFIKLRESHIHMANLCVQYLNFKCFGTLHDVENQVFVAAGAYAFQEYATLNWIYHAQLIFKPGTGYGDGDRSSLLKFCLSLISLHDGLLLVPRQGSSLENSDFENQDFRAKLSLLQGIYDRIHSISDDEQSEDSMPYLLRHLSQTRSIIEKSYATENPPSELMTKAYGIHVFKCSVLSCSRFQYGYKNNQIRNRHQLTHRGGFECTHQGCDFSVLGFSTSQELAKHMTEHESAPGTISFPKVQRCSLRKSLETAIDQDDAVAVRALCVEDPDSLLAKTLPQRAVNRKSREALKVLLRVLPTDATKNIRKAMHLAAETGDVELANLVIAKGADLGSNRSEINPLSVAARQGHAPIVELLLNQSGRDLDLKFKGYQAPLLAAAEGGHGAVLRVLMDKHGKAYAQNKIYYEAIISAGLEGHETAVRILLETGYNLSSANILPKEVYDLAPDVESMFAKMMQLTTKTAGERLPAAALIGHVGEVLRLLKAGADINQHYPSKGTALSVAVSKEHLSLVQALLDRGADINADGNFDAAADVNAQSGGLGTPLMHAASVGSLAIVKLLLERNADVNQKSSYQETALHGAVGKGHESVVSLLLEHGADVNVQSASLVTPLIRAADRGHLSIVKLLLERNADVSQKNLYQQTALHGAVSNGHENVVSLLLEYGADINAQSGGSLETPLIQAASVGSLSIVKLLLEHNVDVNQKTADQETTLHRAVSNGHENIVSLLLQRGANVNAESESLGTPLIQAAIISSLSIVKLLLEQNADVNRKNSYQQTALDCAAITGHENIISLLLQRGANVNAESKVSGTVFTQAASMGYLSIVKSLLEQNVDVNQKNSEQETALYCAIRHDHEDIANLLLDHGAGVNAESGSFEAPLIQAASKGSLSIVKLLLERNADVNLKKSGQKTALLWAVSNGHETVVSLLLEYGADVNAQSESLGTPLIQAASMGSLSIVKLLLEQNADVNRKNLDQQTALHGAVSNGHENVVSLLLEYGADVNAQLGGSLETPLIQAASTGSLSIVKLLLEHNADVNRKNSDQKTALDYAAINGHENIISLLLQHGANVNADSKDSGIVLTRAASMGDLSVVKLLLEQNLDVNQKNSEQETALYCAIRHDHEDIANLLLDHGAGVNAESGSFEAPLIQAASMGHLSIVKSLLERNINTNQNDTDGNKALVSAVRGGHDNVISLLLEYGADVNVQSGGSLGTPLIQAASMGSLPIVELLLERNADVNQKNPHQETALHRAVSNSHENVVSLLLEHGADVNVQSASLVTPLIQAATMGSLSIIKLLLEHNADVNQKNSYQETALHRAVRNGHENTVSLLLEHRATTNAESKLLGTALMYAAFVGSLAMVKLLLERNADVNQKNSKQETALLWAVRNGHEDTVSLLLEHGADVNAQSASLVTPVMQAADRGHLSIVKLLLEQNANVNQKTSNQEMALHRAVSKGHENVVSLLLEHGADVNAESASLETPFLGTPFLGTPFLGTPFLGTPLMQAASMGSLSIVKLLLEQNADVNQKNSYQQTALACAKSAGHKNVVTLLVEHGAKVRNYTTSRLSNATNVSRTTKQKTFTHGTPRARCEK